ncbi:hypothetical protein PVA17_24430 [Lysinibacillus sp. CNPSo 3705]|uniref:hypothetical protein n=1 Tax=Lysinibacillus sp. CNPSo 3705 TaxID=3028148 RepID=UPI0023632C97|nr:hypothetical protein [Lysinibacillus sp. CNPSo 3705]MDD1505865.1 hypothetical protein [Lysinibacillus sp. CNPSo 3705]
MKRKWFLFSSIVILSSSVYLTGCSPTKFIEKGTTEKEEAKDIKNDDSNKKQNYDEKAIKESKSGSEFENIANEYEMSESQKDALEKSESKNALDAVKHNNLDQRVVVKKNVPSIKSEFKNADEASQFFSYALFMYYSENWDGSTFYKTMKPYLHKEFSDVLPSKDEDRVKMYNSLQELFREQLGNTIEEYEMTKLYDGDSEDERIFFRKYILSNREEIFYKTTIKKNGNEAWQIKNDEPTAGYHTGQAKFAPAFIEKKKEN